ncbi:MAG: hypothetical protein JNL02_17610 [Saprospiraceae bacterium]|nr:hypothetical protein [Saprospiraceae bacterium]
MSTRRYPTFEASSEKQAFLEFLINFSLAMKKFVFYFLLLSVVLGLAGCPLSSSDNKTDGHKSGDCAYVIDKIDTTGAASRMRPLSIIGDDILDTAFQNRQLMNVQVQDSDAPLVQDFYFIGPDGKVVQGNSSLTATGVATSSGSDWQIGTRTVTSGETGDYLPLRLTIEGRNCTLLVRKSQLVDAYLLVK